jgi:hypothetical protein
VTSPGTELLYATAGLVSGRETFSSLFEGKEWQELRGLLPKDTLSVFENLMLDYGDRCKSINELARRFMSTSKGTTGYTNEEVELIRSFGRQFEAAEVLRFKAAVALHVIAESIGLQMRTHVLYVTEIAQRDVSLEEIIAVAQSSPSSFNSTGGHGTYRVEWWKKQLGKE